MRGFKVLLTHNSRHSEEASRSLSQKLERFATLLKAFEDPDEKLRSRAECGALPAPCSSPWWFSILDDVDKESACEPGRQR